MTTVALQREIETLKERQQKMEEWLGAVFGYLNKDRQRTDLRPEYVRKILRISKEMRAGKGVATVRTREELQKFLNDF